MKLWTYLTFLRRVSRKLWLSVTLYALLAVVTTLLSIWFGGFVPQSWSARFQSTDILPILTILASSMLAVSTFSLNVMVSAHNAAAAQATPRVHRILQANPTTQRVLAAFIGTFVYSLSTIILFKTGMYGPGTPVFVLVTIIVVAALVVIAFLRWVDHLSDLGSMDNTIRVAEEEAKNVLEQSRKSPALGAEAITDKTVIPADAKPLRATRSGYLQLIDVEGLSRCLDETSGVVYVTLPIGDMALKGEVVGHIASADETVLEKAQSFLTFGDTRTHEQDTRNGLMILGEISSRAMSPGINDPGTAIHVISRQTALLWAWAHADRKTTPDPKRNVFVTEFTTQDLLQAAFSSISRDGAGTVEVVERLLKSLAMLSTSTKQEMVEGALKMAEYVKDHADAALSIPADKKRVAAQLKAMKEAEADTQMPFA